MHRIPEVPVPIPSPLEEAVLTWLAGAALVSGASRISAFVDPPSRRLTLVDDGAGLPAREFSRCHGFSPSLPEGPARTMGAALRPALLVAGTATVESRRNGRRAVRFSLGKGGVVFIRRVRARGLVPKATGTAVTLLFPDRSSALLDPEFVKDRMLKRFSSLIHGDHAPGVVTISVDGKAVRPAASAADAGADVAPAVADADGKAVRPVASAAGAGASVPQAQPAVAEPDVAGGLNAAVALLLPDYPELAPVVGARLPETPRPRAPEERAGKAGVPDASASARADVFDSADVFGSSTPLTVEPAPAAPEAGAAPEAKATPPSITLGWEEDPTRDEPGRMEETTLILNRLHPAWEAAKRDDALAYHAAVCLALVLSRSIEPGKQVDVFIARFLESWGIIRTER